MAEYAPNIKKAIIAREVLSPYDREKEFSLSEGNIFHGEMTPDQLSFLRPAPCWANYRARSAASTCAVPARTPEEA